MAAHHAAPMSHRDCDVPGGCDKIAPVVAAVQAPRPARVHCRLRASAVAHIAMAALVWSRSARARSPNPPTTTPPGQDVSRVLVHVDGVPDALLQQDARGDGQWTTVCRGTCEALVPVGPAYRIDGDGMRTSSAFHLGAPSAGGNVTLGVTPGSSGRFALGVVLASVGAAAVAGGIVAVLVSLSEGGGSEANEPSPPSLVPGAVVIGLGAVAVIGGIVLIVHDATTAVRQQSTAPPRRLPRRVARRPPCGASVRRRGACSLSQQSCRSGWRDSEQRYRAA